MRKHILWIGLLFTELLGTGQAKLLTLEDALVKNRTSLAPENLRQLQFIYGTEDYIYLQKLNNRDVWVRGNLKSVEQPFLTLSDLNQKLRSSGSDTVVDLPP